MQYWFRINFISGEERGSMLCKGRFSGEAIQEAIDRLDDKAEILSCVMQAIYEREYKTPTIDGKPRKAFE